MPKKDSEMVRISTEHHRMLKELAQADHRSMTNWLEKQIEDNYKKLKV